MCPRQGFGDRWVPSTPPLPPSAGAGSETRWLWSAEKREVGAAGRVKSLQGLVPGFHSTYLRFAL